MHLCISFCVCMRVCARVCEVRGARCADLWIWRSDEIFIMHELCLGWEQLCINQGSPNSSLLELCSVLFSEFCSFITAPPKEKKKKTHRERKVCQDASVNKRTRQLLLLQGGKEGAKSTMAQKQPTACVHPRLPLQHPNNLGREAKIPTFPKRHPAFTQNEDCVV